MWETRENEHGQLDDANLDLDLRAKSMFMRVIQSGAKVVAAGSRHSMVLKQDDNY